MRGVRTLARTHRYLSLFVAPAMIFFAISGALQSYRLQEDHKDGYRAPFVLKVMGEVHKAEHLSKGGQPWFRAAQTLLAAVFLATAVAGIWMGFRMARPRWPVWLALATGLILPLLMAIAARP